MTYTLKIAEFEGPFDLILYFIERDEIDIYDIPIAKVTNDFLAHIRDLKELNIDVASEFILVAATLMKIKARTLLPRKEINEKGEEIDPREELVAKLLEYKKYKAAIEDLRELEDGRYEKHKRGHIGGELKSIYASFDKEMDLESINLYKLMQVFNKVIQRQEERLNAPPIHQVVKYPWTIIQQREFILGGVAEGAKKQFVDLFEQCENKIHAIFRFLALLELIQEKIVSISVGLGHNNFWINEVQAIESSVE